LILQRLQRPKIWHGDCVVFLTIQPIWKTTVDNSGSAPSSPCSDIAAEISRYCAAHRDAGDTLDGIAWWLMQQRFHDTRDEIAAAAESLLHKGVLHRRVLADGTALFCCRPAFAQLQPDPAAGDDNAANTDH
jgi:hypothetical protein